MPHMRRFDQMILFHVLLFLPWVGQAAAPLFARFTADRPSPYAGEAFVLVIAIHVTGDTLGKQLSINNLPATNDLQVGTFEELPIETVTLDTQPYEVRKFRAWARAPRPGAVTLAPRLDGTLVRTTRSNVFMQESRRGIQIPVEPFSIPIRQLPNTGRPAGFSGLVGTFALAARAAPLDIAPGDLVTLTSFIQGDVLPETYARPELRAIPYLKTYEIKFLANESSATCHVMQQILVPDTSVLKAIPALSLVVFDTKEEHYKTLTAGPFPLRTHAERAPVEPVLLPSAAPRPATAVTNPPPARPGFWDRLMNHLGRTPEATVAGSATVQVYFAPSEASEPLFTLKPGTQVSVETSHEDWVRIHADAGIGWVRKDALH